MTVPPPPIAGPLGGYLCLLERLHRLFQDEKGDSPEADKVRDQMDSAWDGLTEEDCEIARGLACDLRRLWNAPAPAAPPQARII
jgi:hypothetical protein